MTKIEGYKIPETIDPDSTLCFKVYIPDDPLYRAAFWQSFRHLTTWAAWERDPEHKAKDVAEVWKVPYELSRLTYELGEDCGMPEGVELRVEGCELQFLDPCTETWKPVNTGGASEDYDPLHDDPVPVPYPEPDPDGETGTSCIAAANAALGLKEIIDRLDTAYFEGNILIWLEVTIVLWALHLVKWITQLIMNVTQATTTYTYEEFHADYLEFNWSQLRDELHCFYDDNGVMSQSQWEALVTRLGELEGTSLIWLFLKLIVQGVGSVGMTNGATHRYVESAECADCGQWVRYYRTTHSDWPQWVNGQPGTGYETSGDYVAGSGWSVSTYQSGGSTYSKMVVLNLGLAGMNLERIIVKAHGTTSTPSNGPLGFVIYDLQHGSYWTSGLAPDDTVFDITLDEAGSTNNIMIQIGLDVEGSFAALAGSGFVYDIELRGTGTAPTGGV